MARKGFKKYTDRRTASSFKIQITSMVDMFIILLVFLLKSFSTSPVNITPSASLNLPQSTVTTDLVDVIKVVVSKSAIFVEDNKVADIVNGDFEVSQIDQKDKDFIRPFYDELDKNAQKTRKIASVNDTVAFDGKILMQIDRDLPYSVIKRIMYTSMLAGYYDVKFAVISKD
jgi:biopolymer transport protein ExbD